MKNAKCYYVWAQCGKRRSDKSEENNRTIIGYRESKSATQSGMQVVSKLWKVTNKSRPLFQSGELGHRES